MGPGTRLMGMSVAVLEWGEPEKLIPTRPEIARDQSDVEVEVSCTLAKYM